MSEQEKNQANDQQAVAQKPLLKDILSTLANPGKSAEAGGPGLPAAITLLSATALIFGLVFQFMIPRLLDQLPMLGGIRKVGKLLTFSKDAAFDFGLFFRFLLGAVLIIACWYVLALIAGFVSRDKALRCPVAALRQTAACAVPFTIATLLALPLFFVHYGAGLLPIVALLFCTYIHHLSQVKFYRLTPAVAIYTSPLVWFIQIYCFTLVMP
jgi:hypothetical protein